MSAKPRGCPFKKGDDPNRHKLGRVSRQRAGWMDAMLNAFVLELDPAEAGKVRAKLYRQGRLIPETDDRIGGKVTQPISGDTEGGAIRIEVVHLKSESGNGNGGNGHTEDNAK